MPPQLGLNHASVHPYGVYNSKEMDRILIAIQNEREFQSFCPKFNGKHRVMRKVPGLGEYNGLIRKKFGGGVSTHS